MSESELLGALYNCLIRDGDNLHNVLAGDKGEVAPDGAGGAGEWGGRADHLTALTNDILSLEDHGDDGAGAEELAQSGEERTRRQVMVMLLGVLLCRLDHFECDQFETTLFEPRDDLAYKTSLDCVRLQHDVA